MIMIKKWWFFVLVPLIMALVLLNVSGPKVPKAYEDYIFYGISQHVVKKGKLDVIFSVRGFPPHKHTVYTEIQLPNGDIDWLATVEHTGTHKAHYNKHAKHLKPYKASYNVGKLKPGKYKLRITFEFKYGILGHLNPVPYYSNWVEFEVK